MTTRIDDIKVTPIGSAAQSLLGPVAARQAEGGVEFVGLPTGLHKVDYLTGGMQPDCMWVIGARTSVGKTSLALDIGLHVARAGKRVLLYSQEMRAEALAKRIISRMTHLSGAQIERGLLTDAQLRDVRDAAEELGDIKLGVVDHTLTSETLCQHALDVKEKRDVALVIVDHAQALADSAGLGETEKVGQISNRIRQLARPDRMNCPIVLLAQLNRGSEHREDPTPTLSDLRNSGNLEQDAEVVLLLYRPYLYERMKGANEKDVEEAQIIIAKNRDGGSGSTSALFYPRETRWEQRPPVAVVPRTIGEAA